MSILGSTTTNIGLEVPLKLTFTGVGPYQYKISDGLTATAIKDTTILVMPRQTTTYQVVEVANKCGVGLPGNGATATITVLVPTIRTLALSSTSLCAGTRLTTTFQTTGTFNPGSFFTMQLVKDTVSKFNYSLLEDIQVVNNQITGKIPDTLLAGTYWVNVVASNPKYPILGTVSPTALTVKAKTTASLTGSQAIYEGQPAKLSVTFAGDGPWSFAYRDSTSAGPGNPVNVSTSTNPHPFEVRPAKTTTYLLTGVSNVCGNGTLGSRIAVITVSPLLAVDDPLLAEAVEVFPVPASNALTVRIKGLSASEKAVLELTDLTGKTVMQQVSRHMTTQLSLILQPAGTYMLRIRVGERTASKRVMKL